MRSADHSKPIAHDSQLENPNGGTEAPAAGGSVAAQERRLTVVTRYREQRGRVPEIRMGGSWLIQAGFPAGSRLAITVTPGHLVVKVVAPPTPPRAREVHEGPATAYSLTPSGEAAARRHARRLLRMRESSRR